GLAFGARPGRDGRSARREHRARGGVRDQRALVGAAGAALVHHVAARLAEVLARARRAAGHAHRAAVGAVAGRAHLDVGVVAARGGGDGRVGSAPVAGRAAEALRLRGAGRAGAGDGGEAAVACARVLVGRGVERAGAVAHAGRAVGAVDGEVALVGG